MLCAGTLMAGSCSPELQALAVGLQAAADEFDRQNTDDDISFGDWLADELEH
jgi:hypothetical protein